MKRALLDVNVLLALLDADHVDHASAREWLSAEIRYGWASCAITQNGFVRVITQPRYPSPVAATEAIDRLERATRTAHHRFWLSAVSLLDERLVDRTRVHGTRQVTDVYLLALAVTNEGRFVTFDRSVPVDAVVGARKANLVVL